jgi:hypothetical protein
MPVLLAAVGVVVERSRPLSARPGQPRPAAGRGQVEVMTRTTVEVMTRRGLEVGSHYRPAGTSAAVVAGHAMVPVGGPRNARSRRALGPDGLLVPGFTPSARPADPPTPRHGSRWAPRRGSLCPASRCRHRPAPGHPRAPGTLPRRGGRVTNGGGLPSSCTSLHECTSSRSRRCGDRRARDALAIFGYNFAGKYGTRQPIPQEPTPKGEIMRTKSIGLSILLMAFASPALAREVALLRCLIGSSGSSMNLSSYSITENVGNLSGLSCASAIKQLFGNQYKLILATAPSLASGNVQPTFGDVIFVLEK